MTKNINNSDRFELLNQAVSEGIIDIESVHKVLEMKKNQEYLSMHKYNIWEDKSGKWFTYLPDDTKKEKRKKVKKSSQADIEKAVIAFYKSLEVQNSQKQSTLRSIYPQWLAYKQAHTDKTNYISRINTDWKRFYITSPDIIDTPVSKLTKIELDLWIHGLIKEYELTKTAYYNMSIIIRQCLDYAVDVMQILDKNIFASVKIDKKLLKRTAKPVDESQVFLVDETERIVQVAMNDFKDNPQNTAPLAILFAFLTGLRRGEIVALKESDIVGNILRVTRMEHEEYDCSDIDNIHYTSKKIIDSTKTEAGTREIPLLPAALNIIECVKSTNRLYGLYDNGFLFVNTRGSHMESWQVAYRIKKYCREIGIAPKSFHKIRKTYISALLDNHININEIRKVCGHADERTTLRNYCFNRKNTSETKQQFQTALIQDNGLDALQKTSFVM